MQGINPYVGILNPQELIDLQEKQYDNIIPVEASIDANSSRDLTVNISSEGHFQLWYFTMGFTTLQAGPADNGINNIFCQLIDGAQTRTLFTGNVNAALIASPGRLRGNAGVGNPDEPLRLVYPFRYMFPRFGTIIMRCRNDHDFANTVSIAYYGTRIRTMD